MQMLSYRKICVNIYDLDYFNFFKILFGPKKKMFVYNYLIINLNLSALKFCADNVTYFSHNKNIDPQPNNTQGTHHHHCPRCRHRTSKAVHAG